MRKPETKPKWRKVITEFGVPLHIYSMPQATTVACGVRVNAGAIDERWPEEAGLAHAIEHMLFQGTEELPDSKAITSVIEDTGGSIDALTGKESTLFYTLVPADEIEKSFYVLSQLLVHPTLPEEKVAVEMKIILEEIKAAQDDSGDYAVNMAIAKMYGTHPFGREVAGTKESVSRFIRADFVRWLSHYYHANNFDFIVSGKLPDDSERKVAQLFSKYFHGLRENVPNQREISGRADGTKFHFEERQIQQVHVALLAPTCPGNSDDAAALSIFQCMISGGMSFPLFCEVRDKLGLCYEIWAENIRFSDIGFFLVYAATDADRYQETVRKICEVISGSKTDGALLERAKKVLRGRVAIAFEKPTTILQSARNDIAIFGKPRDMEDVTKRVNSVSILEIHSAVNKYLDANWLSRIFLVPNGLKIARPDEPKVYPTPY